MQVMHAPQPMCLIEVSTPAALSKGAFARSHSSTFHAAHTKKRLECGMELARSIPAKTLTFHFSANEHRKREQPPLAASKFP